MTPQRLFSRLGLFDADYAVAIFPLAAFAEKVNALEAFEDCSVFLTAAAGGSFKAVVL
jgi:hypothetical protein